MAGVKKVVNDYECLRGRQNETVLKQFVVGNAAESETFRFKSPYKMADHGSSGNSLNWADGHIEYKELHTVLTKALAGFAHHYAYGVSKCTFLVGLTGRRIHILEDIECPHLSLSITNTCVHCHATSFPNSLWQPKPRIRSTIG